MDVKQVHVASMHGGDVDKATQDTTHHVHAPTTAADMVPDVAEADGERHSDGWAEAAPFVVGKATGTCAEPRIHRSPCQQRSDNRVQQRRQAEDASMEFTCYYPLCCSSGAAQNHGHAHAKRCHAWRCGARHVLQFRSQIVSACTSVAPMFSRFRSAQVIRTKCLSARAGCRLGYTEMPSTCPQTQLDRQGQMWTRLVADIHEWRMQVNNAPPG